MDPRGSGEGSDSWEDQARSFFDWIRESPVMLLGVIVLLVVGYFAFTLVYTVDRDEEAVVLRFGKFARLEGPGLHWKLPNPFETAYIVNTQRVFSQEFGFRSAGQGFERKARERYKHESLMLTGDLGVARVEWVVQYQKSEPKKFLFNIRDEEVILREASFAAVRRIVGDYFATDVITTARENISREVEDELQEIMDSYNSGILISDVLIQSSEPPETVVPAFKEVDSARQDRERIRNEALQQQEKILNEVQGQVEQMLSEAQGDSAATLNRARGDARRFREILAEYQQAPEVTETRMYLETMEKVINRSDNVYIVDDEVKGVLPLLNLRGGPKQ